MRLRVLEPGPLTTVQDQGRPGHAALGVAASGALDPSALRLANRLVGNPETAAGLELTLGGLVVQCDQPCLMAVTGAPVVIRVDAAEPRTYGSGSAVPVPRGAVVRVEPPVAGLRSWLAVRGGLDVPMLLGSASTDLLAGFGSPLAAGDALRVGSEPSAPVPALDQAPVSVPAAGPLEVRVVLGPHDDWFAEGAVGALATGWAVDERSNRVGLRLRGEPMTRRAEAVDRELPSAPMVPGAVQVPPDGHPVVFLADHPVTGGYPVLACVLADDLPLLAQAAPGQTVRFRPVSGPPLPGARAAAR